MDIYHRRNCDKQVLKFYGLIGLQSTLKTSEFSHKAYPKRETCLLPERFRSDIIREYGNHSVSTDGGTWYPQACRFLKLVHHLHAHYEKSIIERTIMQYIKDRVESFDDYFPCKKNKCKLNNIKNGLSYLLTNIIKQ